LAQDITNAVDAVDCTKAIAFVFIPRLYAGLCIEQVRVIGPAGRAGPGAERLPTWNRFADQGPNQISARRSVSLRMEISFPVISNMIRS
jgi:hypothetical protein